MQNVNSIPPENFPKSPNLFDALGNAWETVIEKPLDAVGLLERPLLRSAVFATGTTIALFYSKPEAQFINGKPRSWSLLNPEDPNSTPFPWFVVTGTIAFLTGLFV